MTGTDSTEPNKDGRPNLRLVPDLEPEQESPTASHAVDAEHKLNRDDPAILRPFVRIQINVDKDYFSTATSGEVPFPEDFDGPIELSLTETTSMIGRASEKQETTPEIDLAKLTSDPAVSIRHAEVSINPSNEVTITDLGSTNGTVVGQPSGPDIDVNTKVPLPEGASAYMGAWTKLTVIASGHG